MNKESVKEIIEWEYNQILKLCFENSEIESKKKKEIYEYIIDSLDRVEELIDEL